MTDHLRARIHYPDSPIPGSYFNGHYVPMSAEKTAYQASHIDAWAKSIKYGYYGLYFFAVAIFLAAFVNMYFVWERRRRSTRQPTSSLLRKVMAFGRWTAYLRLPYAVDRWIAPLYTTGSLAQTTLLAFAFIFCTGWCFGISYWYRPAFWGSSPLGLRSEWLAIAMLPFLFVLGQKRNLIGTFTGTAYEKLQVLHQGVAGLHFYMSLVHTGAMSVRGARELGLMSNSSYLTGWICLGPLIWLCVASLPILRSKAYEGFWFLHLFAVIVYLVTLWYHVVDELNSNAYMYATFAVFAYGFAIRMGWLLYRNITLHTAHITTSSTGALLVTVPTRMRWNPGQHVVLRFPSVRPLESHPFTMALPAGDGEEHQMRFMVLPRDGFTGVLAKKVAQADGPKSLRVIVDGPFGESGLTFRAYDSALLLAGGTGIAHVLPIFMDLVALMKSEQSTRSLCNRVELVWAVRDMGAAEWFTRDIEDAVVGLSRDQVTVRIMVTSGALDGKDNDSVDDEKDVEGQEDAGNDESTFSVVNGRPDLASLVRSRSQEWSGRMAVSSCGPAAFASDVCNASAAVELDILAGATKCDELFLSSSLYSW
ncbi:hypothetical protein PENSPDRAFT_675358 [Peniophora sp. CONT]|nr:hypothetical protein PENSPDRAFT_675358 [Peniophora sp. CONT]